MREIRASDIEDCLPETFVITREGKPIARLVSETVKAHRSRGDVLRDIEAFRKRMSTKVTVEEILAWRREGHKY